MSAENVEVVRNGLDAFNAFMRGEGAEKALAALADPEFKALIERNPPAPGRAKRILSTFKLS